MKKDIQLTTGASRLSDLDAKWIDKYDGVYLGDPFCSVLKGNLLEDKDGLKEAISLIHSCGKKAYLSTYVEPWTEEVPAIISTIGSAIDNGIDAIEILNIGVLYECVNCFPDVKIHINGFIQILNDLARGCLEDKKQVERYMPYYELSLEEINGVMKGSDLELQMLVHGIIPLGYAEACVIKPDQIKSGKICAGDCYSLKTFRRPEMVLSALGRVTSSGKEMCMLSHLKEVMEMCGCFRIESRARGNEYREKVGEIYRGCVDDILSQGSVNSIDEKLSVLEGLSNDGFCNGYYFGKPGREFVK